MAEPAGLTVLEPQQDKGNQAEAGRVASAILQPDPQVVGLAGFDWESGPGMGQAIRDMGRAGRVVATCVETEEQHLRLLKEGVLTACIGQKRKLFTYYGVMALRRASLGPRVQITPHGRAAGITPDPRQLQHGDLHRHPRQRRSVPRRRGK